MLSFIICLVYFITNNQFLLNWIRTNLVKIWFIFLRSFKSLWVRPRSCPTILRYGSYTCEYFKISQQDSSIIWTAFIDSALVITTGISNQLQKPFEGFFHRSKFVTAAMALSPSPIKLQIYLKLFDMVEIERTCLHKP